MPAELVTRAALAGTQAEAQLALGLVHTSAHAARYTILRRLAPSLKHDLVVHLQGVSILTEILAARLDRGGGHAEGMQLDIEKMNRLARSAIGACLVVAGWIDTADGEGIALHDGISESVALLQSSLGFAGFSIRNETPETELQVCRVMVRNLVCACLIILADTAIEPCELVVQTQAAPNDATVRISRGVRTASADMAGFERSNRLVQWSDVQSLAQVEGVKISRDEDSIELLIPRMQVTSPLKIVPL